MLRAALSILIGAVLALLLAVAAQFMVLPLVGVSGLGVARVIGFIVFWAILAVVVATVVRGLRAAERPGDSSRPGGE